MPFFLESETEMKIIKNNLFFRDVRKMLKNSPKCLQNTPINWWKWQIWPVQCLITMMESKWSDTQLHKSKISVHRQILFFDRDFYIVVLGMTFFHFTHTFSIFFLDFYFPFLFGLLYPFSNWTFISLFFLLFPLYFFFSHFFQY